MAFHLFRIGAITLAIVFCTFYPFLPGPHDGLSLAVSVMAQTFGVVGLLLVPVGALWLTYELRTRARTERNLATKASRYRFVIASVIALSLVGVAISLSALASAGLSFGLAVTALWTYILLSLVPRLRLQKAAGGAGFNYAPLYLVLIPSAVLVVQWCLASPVIEFSRSYAILHGADLIRDIETYRVAHGRYPESLAALWQDYDPSVIGIERFQYAQQGDAYNFFFEQPSLQFGTREIVMYNKLDEHVMPSHDTYLLARTPDQLRVGAGWYAVHDAPHPHWKYFWFD
jgi:hypothetical protein